MLAKYTFKHTGIKFIDMFDKLMPQQALNTVKLAAWANLAAVIDSVALDSTLISYLFK